MKKKILIILLVVIVYILLIGLIFGFGVFINNQKYLIVNNDAIFENKKNSWIPVENKKSITGKKYITYVDYQDLGYTKMQFYNDTVYSYKKGKSVFYDQSLLAYSYKYKIVPIRYDLINCKNNEEDREVLSNYLSSLNISDDDDILFFNKYSLDFDGDGQNETLYNASNVFLGTASKKYSALFINDNNKFIDVHTMVFDENQDKKSIILYSIIDIYNDGKLEIITDESSFGANNQCYNMYEYSDKGIKKLYEC